MTIRKLFLSSLCGVVILLTPPGYAETTRRPGRLADDGSTSVFVPARLNVMSPGGRCLDLAAQPGWKVIYFWASSCPCVKACERYSFRPLAAKYRGEVAFYAVASGRYDLSMARPKLTRSIRADRLPYPVFLDPGGTVAHALGAHVTPQTFLLDPQNRIVFSGMPDDSRRYLGDVRRGVSRTYLEKALSQALSGRPVLPAQTENQGCVIGP